MFFTILFVLIIYITIFVLSIILYYINNGFFASSTKKFKRKD